MVATGELEYAAEQATQYVQDIITTKVMEVLSTLLTSILSVVGGVRVLELLRQAFAARHVLESELCSGAGASTSAATTVGVGCAHGHLHRADIVRAILKLRCNNIKSPAQG